MKINVHNYGRNYGHRNTTFSKIIKTKEKQDKPVYKQLASG